MAKTTDPTNANQTDRTSNKPVAKSATASPRHPRFTIVVAGLVACAAPARNAESRPLRASGAGYEVEVLVDGAAAPTYWHDGESYVLGHTGDRYLIRVHNRSGRRIEAVVTVDGRDVVDGKAGDFRSKRGYLVPAWGQVDIDGWRLSESRAAAFRFSSVADSYAARMGQAREVGVIGVAVFPERVYQPRPIALPPPCCIDHRDGDASAGTGHAAKKNGMLPQVPAPMAAAESARGADLGRSKASSDFAPASPARRERPGLGTQFGEAVTSHIQEVEFVRANPSSPSVVLGLRYNDRDGLVAMGVNVDDLVPGPSETDLRRTAEPFPVQSRRYARPPAGWQRY